MQYSSFGGFEIWFPENGFLNLFNLDVFFVK